MQSKYLEITFRKGKPLAAYLYFSKKTAVQAVKTEPMASGLIVDYDEKDKPIGLEILSPQQVTVSEINNVLSRLSIAPASDAELSPLKAA
ncbi:MAG: DUF2283 domain-containing protein [bacterium]